jgi:lipoate-protein ligase A
MDPDAERDIPTDPAFQMALAHAMVRQAGAGELETALRIYQPRRPSVVFGRRDTRLPGFAAAISVAREAGFATAIRASGGRAVAYTEQALVIDHVQHESQPMLTQSSRFADFGALLVAVMQRAGIDARLGAVPGEYCPGAHSVNARGQAKLVGTAQRVVGAAWLFSSLIVVGDAGHLQAVLTKVYAALGLPFEPESVGSMKAEAPEATVDSVRDLVTKAYLDHGIPSQTPLEHSTVSVAHTLLDQHTCS